MAKREALMTILVLSTAYVPAVPAMRFPGQKSDVPAAPAMKFPGQEIDSLNVTKTSEISFFNNFNKFIQYDNDGFYSPIGVYTIVTEIALAAGGNTLKQLADAISFHGRTSIITDGLQRLMTELNNSKSINLFNQIIVYKDYNLNKQWSQHMENKFNVNIMQYAKPTADSIKQINDLVDINTNHTITNFISKNDVNSKTSVLLLNAAHFEGHWKYPFDSRNTHVRSFTDLKGRPRLASIMVTHLDVKQSILRKYPHVRYFELPYQNDDIKMVLVYPNTLDKTIFYDIAKEFVYSKKDELLLYSLTEVPVKFSMPKFKIESKLDLKPILEKMNVTDLFTSVSNLKYMINTTLEGSRIFQKSLIEVNEFGTNVDTPAKVSSNKDGFHFNFEIISPFIFSIVSNKYGELFKGVFTGENLPLSRKIYEMVF